MTDNSDDTGKQVGEATVAFIILFLLLVVIPLGIILWRNALGIAR